MAGIEEKSETKYCRNKFRSRKKIFLKVGQINQSIFVTVFCKGNQTIGSDLKESMIS